MAHRVVYSKDDYARVEYLESTGTQWIDTLYKMKLYDELRFKVKCLGNTDCAIFGSRGASTLNFYQMYINTDAVAQFAFGQHEPPTIWQQVNSFQNNGINEITIKDGLCICNGVNTSTPLGVEDSVQNLAIFARRNQDNTVSYKIKMRLYYFKIYSNNVLVRDFIPVRVDNIGYMYDKVSGKLFGNKGTGSFVLGPDIANPIPNIRRVFRFGNKRFVMPMPYDSKVEYLESTGTQWINTDIYYQGNIGIDAEIAFSNTLNNNIAFRNSVTGKTIGLLTYNNRIVSQRVYMTNNGVVNITADTDYHIIKNFPTYCQIDDTKVNYNGNFGNKESYPILLYKQQTNNTTGKVKIKYFKIYNNNILICDLIPVRRGNIGYMYDRVSGRLFCNDGTGDFIIGNDIND